MDKLLWVCFGGALGSGGRYLVSIGAARVLGAEWPYGTFAVNVVGSFLLGLMLESFLELGGGSTGLRLALTTGAMGGFTTYSTFNYETLAMVETGRWGAAVGYLAATVLVCLFAGLAGIALGRQFAG